MTTLGPLTPSTDWDAPRSKGHSVQFYEDESFLLEGLSRFIGAAIAAGDSAVVIATKAHHDGLRERLANSGLDLAVARKQGRFLSLDAAETLARFMVDGHPDPSLFENTVGPIISQLASAPKEKSHRVAAFGEMVALLWAEGNQEAALQLEQLWNRLSKTHVFQLYCAYPMNLFRQARDGDGIKSICSEYSHIVPAERYAALQGDEERFGTSAVLQHKALALETEMGEREKIQAILQRREAELSDFLENAVVAMHWVASDGTILWANKAELALLGYEREEYFGHHIAEFHVDSDVIDDMLRRLGRQEELHGCKARLRCKDGSIRHVRVDSNVYTEQGKFVHTRCFTTDVTNHQKAEEAQRHLAAIVESSDDAIASKDLNGTITSWNKSAEKLFGYKAEEIVGRPVTTIIPPELHHDEPRILGKIRKGDRIEHFETVRVRKNGERIHVSLTVSPVRDEEGNIIGAAKIVRDITRRKKLEEAALRLVAIVESSDDAIASKDLNGIVTSWNKSAERLFGYKAEEIIGKAITLIIPPELQQDEQMILGKIRRGEKIDHFETVRLHKNGERIDVSLTISPVKDESGTVIGAAKIIRNITENKKIAQALRTTEKLAAAGRLAATIAHEINNPLEAITNLVYLSKRDISDNPRVGGYLELASRELDRVAHIARQTLGFYRDTSAPMRFGVTQALDDLLYLYEKRLESRNIRVLKRYDGNIEINALAGEVRQAFSNLITNALDAMPTGGTLVIRASKSHRWNNSNVAGVRITILDTGSGIAPEHRKNLFQPFFTTKADVGTGLGLWITRTIVEKHRGLIQVKSRTGPNDHGTAFSIFLPSEGPAQGPEASSVVDVSGVAS